MARGLGKGISALMDDDMPEEQRSSGPSENRIEAIPVGDIRPGRYQPRQQFDETALRELSESIRARGIMQPLVLRQLADGGYEIIAGERRWRASQLAELKTVPAIIRTLTDREALELALIENIQRQDLNPLEEGEGYARLMDEFDYTQEQLSSVVGKSRSHIANLLRLIHLPDEVKQMMNRGELSMGHARSLVSSNSPLAHAREIAERKMNVRQAEILVQGREPKSRARKSSEGGGAPVVVLATQPAPMAKDEDIVALEEALSQNIGLKVEIFDKGQQGQVVISYGSLVELDDVLRRLGGVN